MIDHVLFYGLLLVVLCWLCMSGSGKWPRRPVTLDRPQGKPAKPITKRSKDPQPFAGLTHKPGCEACEQAAAPRPQANVMQLSNEASGIAEEPHLACMRADCPWKLPSGAVPRRVGFEKVM